VKQLEAMSTIVDITRLPANEAQVRPLLRIKEASDLAKAWQAAVESSPSGHPVATDVKKAVKHVLAGEPDDAGDNGSSANESTTDESATEADGTEDSAADDATTGEPKRENAVLADNSQQPDALWPSGYVDSQLAQRKLDEIRDRSEVTAERQLVLQELFLRFCEALNQTTEADPDKETRKGIVFLLRTILYNLPLVAANPGDMEPENASVEEKEDGDTSD
jgi:hypothetical protein